MSYGSLYKMSYYNEFNVLTEVYIKKLDYEGATTEVNGGEDPLRMVMSGESSMKFQYIRGTSAEIDLISETDFQFISLHTSDFKQYKIEIYKATVLDWTGWILPDYYQEPYLEPPYVVTIHAADGLGILKNYDLIHSNGSNMFGRQDIRDVLNQIFLKIGTGLSLWENINIYEDNMDSTAADSMIDQSYLNTEIFYDKIGTPMNCYDALTEILKPFNAYITQSKGTWHIIRVPTNKSIYTRRLWTWNDVIGLVYDSNEVHNPQVSTTSATTAHASLVRFVGNELTISPPWKEFTIRQNYGAKASIIRGGEFILRDFTLEDLIWIRIKHWEHIGDPVYLPFPTEGGNNFRRASIIPGSGVPFLFWLHYDPDEDYCLQIGNGSVSAIALADGIVNEGVDIIATTDDVILHLKYLVQSIDQLVYVQVKIEAATDYYMSADGTWDTPEAYIYFANDNPYTWITADLQSSGIPVSGVLTVKLFQAVDPAELALYVNYDEVRVIYLNNGIMLDRELELVTPINSNNIYIPQELNLMIGDMPDHENNVICYDNGLYYDRDTPTSAWTDGNTSISDTLVNSMANAIKIENNRPYQVISGTIYSNLIDNTSVIREINNNNYLYMINSATEHNKSGAWDLELIQFAETYDLLAEDGSTLISETGDQLITE